MAVKWIGKQRTKFPSYAINADSKAALLAITNKLVTHPLAVNIRKKTIDLRKVTSVTFHWIRGHTGQEGNERADYLPRTIASYNTTIIYDAIPISRGKKLLEEYYSKIWDSTYVNSAKASHTKQIIPSIPHRMALSLWPNHSLTQLLTNHGCFRAYLHKMKKVPTPICSCPEESEQTARHLMLECSLLRKERPTVIQNLPLPTIMKYHINTVEVTRFITAIFQMLQDQPQPNQTP